MVLRQGLVMGLVGSVQHPPGWAGVSVPRNLHFYGFFFPCCCSVAGGQPKPPHCESVRPYATVAMKGLEQTRGWRDPKA